MTARFYQAIGLILLVTLQFWALQVAAAEPPTHPTLLSSDLPPLVPLEDFYADQSESWGYKISPDGSKLAWIARQNGKPTVHFKEIDSHVVYTIAARKPVYRLYWAFDSRRVYFYWDEDGDENYHLYVADTQYPTGIPTGSDPLSRRARLVASGFSR